MRHGTAEDSAGSDFSRELTIDGVEGVSRSVDVLAGRDLKPGMIFSSPLVRAQQTARMVKDQLTLDEPIQTLDELSPWGKSLDVIARLEDYAANELCLLVSHQPFVSIFIQYLTGQEVYVDTSDVASILMDEFSCNCGELEWLSHV